MKWLKKVSKRLAFGENVNHWALLQPVFSKRGPSGYWHMEGHLVSDAYNAMRFFAWSVPVPLMFLFIIPGPLLGHKCKFKWQINNIGNLMHPTYFFKSTFSHFNLVYISALWTRDEGITIFSPVFRILPVTVLNARLNADDVMVSHNSVTICAQKL